MSGRAHVFLGVTALVSIFFTVRMARRHHLRSKYSLLWISIALVMAPVVAFPRLLDRASYAIGISYPPATFLVLAVAGPRPTASEAAILTVLLASMAPAAAWADSCLVWLEIG